MKHNKCITRWVTFKTKMLDAILFRQGKEENEMKLELSEEEEVNRWRDYYGKMYH